MKPELANTMNVSSWPLSFLCTNWPEETLKTHLSSVARKFAKSFSLNFGCIAALPLLFPLSACTTTSATSEVMSKWVGVPEARLLASWGAPDRTAALSDGRKVDTWLTDWNDKDGMHTCRKTFTVDSEGKVVHESWFDCTPSPVYDFDTELTTAQMTRFEPTSCLSCKVLIAGTSASQALRLPYETNFTSSHLLAAG
jgi:hypothetical protein